MVLSNDLIAQFVKATRDDKKTSNEATLYGTVVYDGKTYVKLDGSDLLTPVSTTAGVKDGERVTVLIKDHSAIVTGNVSSPSARTDDVNEVADKIDEFGTLMAYKISADELTAISAVIEELRAAAAKITDLEAVTALIESLDAKYANLENVTAEDLEAINADIETLRAIFGEFTDVSTEDLEAVNAQIDNLVSYNADFTYVSAENLTAVKASVEDLDVRKLDAKDADIKFANIDFSNIGEAAIRKLFTDSGIIGDLVMSDGKVTGTLVGVTIIGDLIKGGTVQADKLVIKGEDGLYYKLNVEGGATVSEKISEEDLQNGLSGSIIVAHSITAEKVAVDDLIAFGATIAGFHIQELKDADGNPLAKAIYSKTKQSVDSSISGVYMDDNGQFAVGDGSQYLKFYQGDDGEYHLAIAASSITLSSGKTVEETVDEATNIQIGARNLIRNSKTLIFDRYYFMSNPSGINSTSVLGEGTLGDMILGGE